MQSSSIHVFDVQTEILSPPKERPLGELFSELAAETATLVRKEAELAKIEMIEKATLAGKNAGVVAVGGVLGHAAALSIVAGFIALLSLVMAVWLSAFIVGIVVGGAGYLVAQKGIKTLKRMDPTPRETVQTIKENKLWAQQLVR